jgi:lipopolysaccharide export system permease protein
MRLIVVYFADLFGKDLGVELYFELFFYFSLITIPIALPLAMLISMLMTFGKLGEFLNSTLSKVQVFLLAELCDLCSWWRY